MPKTSAGNVPRLARLAVALVVGCAAVAGVVWAQTRPPAYLAQIDVVLVAPEGREPENPLAPASAGFVDLAGIVAKSVSGSSAADRDVSQGVTLLGQGLRTGWLVRQPNEGNQWVYNFDRPVLNIQAAGRSADEAVATAEEVVARVRADVASRENAAAVTASQRAVVVLNPPTPAVYYYNGDPKRAVVAVLVIALLVGLLLNGVLGRLRPDGRRATRHRGGKGRRESSRHRSHRGRVTTTEAPAMAAGRVAAP